MRSWDDLTKQGFLTPNPGSRLADGEVIRLAGRDWFAVHTPGHTGDHLCLHDTEGVLLSGDHVLPTITPHISGLASSNDALADFFDALELVAGLDDVETVLPATATRSPISPDRAQAIRDHHVERLARLRRRSRPRRARST